MIRVARPSTQIVIADETERGIRAYRWTIPEFERLFEGKREMATAPVDLVPAAMQEVRVDAIWRGLGYCPEFRKPAQSTEYATVQARETS